jgi:SAM-dependent methyltransferase
MLSSWGVPAGPIARSVLLTGVANNAVRLAMPIAAVLPLAMSGKAVDTLLEAALWGVALLAVGVFTVIVLVQGGFLGSLSDGLGRLLSRVSSRFRHGDGTRRLLSEAIGTEALRVLARRWPGLIGATVLGQVTLFAVLLASLRLVGVNPEMVHWSEALAAFALVRLVSLLPITPGGLGVAEAGYAAFLSIGLTEAGIEQVVAGILLFRFATYAVPVPLGAIAAFVWRRHPEWLQTSRERTARFEEARYGMVVQPDWLEDARCFRCAVDGKPVYDLHPFRLVQCPGCGQAYMSPRLNERGRLALYDDADYFDAGVYRTPSASALQRTWAEGRLDLIGDHLAGDGSRLFEIGCAYGLFLEQAHGRGFEVAGLEFSPVAARTASQRLGVPIREGEIIDLDGGETYHAVAAWDVIEHVPDPAAFLEAAGRMLEPGGVVALSCPYYDSIPSRVLRSRWWTLKPHKHIWHFTSAGLCRTLGDAGFEPLVVLRNPLAKANYLRPDSLVAIARRG